MSLAVDKVIHHYEGVTIQLYSHECNQFTSHYALICSTTKNTKRKVSNMMSICPQIYSVDYSGMPLGPKAPNIVAKIGTKKVHYSTGYWKERSNNHCHVLLGK